MAEQEIIRKATEGNAEAFRLIVSQHQPLLYSVAYRFLGNGQDAEDMVQEAFIRLWKNLSKYRADVKLSTWLYKIVVNLCLDVLKSSHRRHQENLVEIKEKSKMNYSSADDEMNIRELHELIQEAASELTPRQKAVFILRDLEEMNVEEVGKILSMSPGNIKSNLYYARRQMSEKLKQYYQTTDKITIQ